MYIIHTVVNLREVLHLEIHLVMSVMRFQSMTFQLTKKYLDSVKIEVIGLQESEGRKVLQKVGRERRELVLIQYSVENQ